MNGRNSQPPNSPSETRVAALPRGPAKVAAHMAHAVLHILDDAEENAQTGIVTLEITKSDWAELNGVINQLGVDPHETLHDLIGVNS